MVGGEGVEEVGEEGVKAGVEVGEMVERAGRVVMSGAVAVTVTVGMRSMSKLVIGEKDGD